MRTGTSTRVPSESTRKSSKKMFTLSGYWYLLDEARPLRSKLHDFDIVAPNFID